MQRRTTSGRKKNEETINHYDLYCCLALHPVPLISLVYRVEGSSVLHDKRHVGGSDNGSKGATLLTPQARGTTDSGGRSLRATSVRSSRTDLWQSKRPNSEHNYMNFTYATVHNSEMDTCPCSVSGKISSRTRHWDSSTLNSSIYVTSAAQTISVGRAAQVQSTGDEATSSSVLPYRWR